MCFSHSHNLTLILVHRRRRLRSLSGGDFSADGLPHSDGIQRLVRDPFSRRDLRQENE